MFNGSCTTCSEVLSMADVLSVWVTLAFLATCWVYWREARYQVARSTGGDASRKAATKSAYIAMAAALASVAYNLCFINVAIPQILELGRTENVSQVLLSVVFLVLISGGNLLIDRFARGVSILIVDRKLKLNNASPILFVADAAKSLAVSTVFGVPLVVGWCLLMQDGSAFWWLAAWALWFVILPVRMLVKPQLETLLFSTAHDLPDGDLRARLEGLLKGCGIGTRSLQVIDASKRTNRVNASVTGLGRHKRIFLYDTLIKRLSAAEVEAVVAHEAGHATYRHLGKAWAGLGLMGLLVACAVAGITGVAQWQSAEAIGLLLATYPAMLLSVRPLLVRISRQFEFQADGFAAKVCGRQAVQKALANIFTANHGVWDHDWADAVVFASHPSGRERIGRLQQAGRPS